MGEYPIIYLDLTGCRNRFDLHARIKKTFDFPDFYGHNWSAFEDLLTTEVPRCKIVITGEYSLSPDLHEDLNTMHEALERTRRNRLCYGSYIDFEVQN